MLLGELLWELHVNDIRKIIEIITFECYCENYLGCNPVNVTGRIIEGIIHECYWEKY